jgi:hypothetical protein
VTVEPSPIPPDPPSVTPPVVSHEPRADLRLVAPATEPPATEPPPVAAITGPQVSDGVDQVETVEEVGDQPAAVKPLAPLDQRLIEHFKQIAQAAPRWSQRPASLAEIWEYSTSGDWTTEEKSAKRLAHALIVVLTFVALYPVSWVVQVALEKPIGFVITIAVVVLLGHIF